MLHTLVMSAAYTGADFPGFIESVSGVTENPYEILIVLFLWTIPAQLLVGILPQEATILFASRYFHPIVITGTVLGGITIAEIINYHTVRGLGRIPQLSWIFLHESFQAPIRWFKKAPSMTLIIGAFIPIIPFFPLRFIAPLSDYPLPKYIGSTLIGRAPKIYLLALLGFTFYIPYWMLLIIAVAPVIILLWRMLFRKNYDTIYALSIAIFNQFRTFMTIPNLLTFSRVGFFLPLTIYGIVNDYTVQALIGLILIGFTDHFDGIIARRWNQVTEFGKSLDYAVDIFCWLVIGFALAGTHGLPVAFVVFLLAREVIHVAYAAYLSTHGIITKSRRVATISGAFTITTYMMYLLSIPFREIVLGTTIIVLIIGSVYYFRLYTCELIKCRSTKHINGIIESK